MSQYYKLNEKEKSILLNHPLEALKIKEATSKAMSETQFRFGPGNHDGNSANAFRHCYWSTLLARDVGYELALKFTNTHEDIPGNKPKDKNMDLYNNAVGLKIGRDQYKSDPVLAEECRSALVRGKLKTLRF